MLALEKNVTHHWKLQKTSKLLSQGQRTRTFSLRISWSLHRKVSAILPWKRETLIAKLFENYIVLQEVKNCETCMRNLKIHLFINGILEDRLMEPCSWQREKWKKIVVVVRIVQDFGPYYVGSEHVLGGKEKVQWDLVPCPVHC